MAKKDKIHDEIQKMFRGLEGKSIEKNAKNIYGIMGDIREIGSVKRKAGWYTKMSGRLDDIKINEAVIFKGAGCNVFVRKMNKKLWVVSYLGEKLKFDSDNEIFIVDSDGLLDYLYKIRD